MKLFNPAFISAAVLVITVLVNVGLATSGISQKLSCTLEQTAVVAAAIMATSTGN